MVLKYCSAFFVFAVHNLCRAQFATFDDVSSKYISNFQSNISFSSFPNTNAKLQPELTTATETSGSVEKQVFSFPLRNDFSQPTATAGISNVSSFKIYKPSTTPSSLETFISTFTNAVHTSLILSNLFDLSPTSIQSIEKFIFYDIYALYKSMGISDPSEIATYSSSPFTENFEILTYPMLVWIDANAMGKHLLAEGILNDTNAVSLALEFAKEMEISAINKIQKDFPKSKYRALIDGYFSFLKSQGLFKTEKLLDIARYYGDEIKLAGKRFGISARNHELANDE